MEPLRLEKARQWDEIIFHWSVQMDAEAVLWVWGRLQRQSSCPQGSAQGEHLHQPFMCQLFARPKERCGRFLRPRKQDSATSMPYTMGGGSSSSLETLTNHSKGGVGAAQEALHFSSKRKYGKVFNVMDLVFISVYIILIVFLYPFL